MTFSTRSDSPMKRIFTSMPVRTSRTYSGQPTSPDVVAEVSLHRAKCSAFCAISSMGVIGPFWFEDGAGATVTVNAQRYRQVISRFWTALRRKLGGAA